MSEDSKSPRIQRDLVHQKSIRIAYYDVDLKSNHQLFKWSLEIADFGGKWGFNNKVFRNEWCKNILPKLLDFERKSWAIIANDSSGKSRGTRNHHVSINDLDKVAQKRLKKLQLDESNSLYSLRLDGKKRIWGIVHNNVLNLLWYDPYHHVCPSKR